MEKSQSNYADWKKADIKEYTLDDSIYRVLENAS
jgi:hypothetical protein